jgi:hypothetical protein
LPTRAVVQIFSAVGGIAAAVVCGAHDARADGRDLTLSIGDLSSKQMVSYEAWVAELRECTQADAASAEKQPVLDVPRLVKRKQAVTIKGRLVPGYCDSLLMGCPGSPCCNVCDFDWFVVPPRCPKWRLAIRREWEDFRLRGGGMDCAVLGFGRRAVAVIVAGRLEGASGDLIVATDICRVGSGAASQLTDAEYTRLMSTTPGNKSTVPRGCPRPPEKPVPPARARAKPLN